jgi:hypothetical protein
MKLVPTFKGKIIGGKIVFENRQLFDLWTGHFEDNTPVWVIVRKESKIRSLQANAYLWVCYTLISEYTGFTPEEIHAICKKKFIVKTLQYGDKIYEAVGSTALMDTMEFTSYVDKVKLWAGEEFGITVPEPDEYYSN